MKKTILIALAIILLGLLGLFLFLSSTRGKQNITVNYVNISEAHISTKDNGTTRHIKPVHNGEVVSIPSMDKEYLVTYKGNDGYASGEYVIPADVDSITVDPDFSEDRLSGILDSERSSIKQAMLRKYPSAERLYTVEDSQLFSKGDWYGAVLRYRGPSFFNRDSVVLVMNRSGDDNRWVVVSKPPMPIVTERTAVGIPGSLVKAMNDRVLAD